MTDTFASVDFGDDGWAVVHGERIVDRFDSKQEAIEAAKGIDSVNSVLAWTKGNSNFDTIRA